MIEKGVAVARELARRLGDQVRYQVELANSLDRLGNVAVQRGEYRSAVDSFQSALGELPELPIESPDIEWQFQRQLAATTHNLAYALMMMGEFGRAEGELIRALDRFFRSFQEALYGLEVLR